MHVKQDNTVGLPTLVSLKEVARDLGVAPSTARRLLMAWGVQCFKLGSGANGTVRYMASEVLEALSQRSS